jgi:hypothetical protein
MFGPTHLPEGMADTLAYSMFRPDFEKKTLRLMKIVRASLIYLSTAIHKEEKHREQESPKKKVFPMPPFDKFDDDWKR